MGIEKRKSKRIDVDVKISLNELGDKFVSGFSNNLRSVHVINISKDGIAFKSDENLALNSFYDTMIKLDNSDTFEAVIEIIRMENLGEAKTTYGCRFVGINAEDRFKIDVYQIVCEADKHDNTKE
ncbi:MAG: PilZ domain-containing protein [Eubacteriales bacterium]|nr:PilZ domain-containing protein [Eubacteriales bacterium]